MIKQPDDLSIIGRRNIVFGALGAVINAQVLAQTKYPLAGRPIRIVIPAPPGGPADLVARAIGERLTQELKLPVVIDSKPGGASVPAALNVSNSPPDGHTILLALNTTHTQVPHMFAKQPYDPFRDFTALTQVYRSGAVLVVHPSLPVTGIRELIEYSRKSGPIPAASPSPGTNGHLYVEMLNRQYGANLNHIPYKGSADATRDLLGGFVKVLFDSPPTAIPNAKSGAVRAIAITGLDRIQDLPEVQTGHEQGFSALDITGWMGFFGPANMQERTVSELNSALVSAIRDPLIKSRFEPLGLKMTGTTPAEFAAIVKKDYDAWGKIIKDAGVKLG